MSKEEPSFEGKVKELIGDIREHRSGRVVGLFKARDYHAQAAAKLKVLKSRFTTCPDDYAEVCKRKYEEISLALDELERLPVSVQEVCRIVSVSEALLCQDKHRQIVGLKALRTLERSEATWKRLEETFTGRLSKE